MIALRLRLLFLIGSLFAAACTKSLTPAERSRIEMVMALDTTITATTARGKIVIHAKSDLGRSYEFDSNHLSVTMWPRTERWYGSLGLYYPAPSLGLWPRRGIYRAVVEEGQQHFNTQEEAISWLRARTWWPYTYRSDGLVVGWGTTPERHQLNAEVWQLYIQGHKPSGLAGADDSSIIVTP